MATPLWNSFDQALPPYPYTGGPHTVHDVGTTAKKTYPPKFAIERSSTGAIPWSQIGRRYLQQMNRTGRVYDIQTALVAARATLPQVTANMQPLFQAAIRAADLFVTGVHSIPQTEENIRHTNEADVVRSANLYLIHPVIQALSSHPSYFQGLVSQSEDWKNRTQTDITFMKVGLPLPASAQDHRDFCVMEFKRRGMIKASYFRHSIPLPRNGQFANQQAFNTHILMPVAPGGQPTQTQIAAVHSVQAPVIHGPNPTQARSMFEPDPIKLMTQAATYAIYHRTRYVALFNYDYLICCHFPWLDPTSSLAVLKDANEDSNGEYPVEVEMYRGDDPEVRHALLGFMWTAIEDTPF